MSLIFLRFGEVRACRDVLSDVLMNIGHIMFSACLQFRHSFVGVLINLLPIFPVHAHHT